MRFRSSLPAFTFCALAAILGVPVRAVAQSSTAEWAAVRGVLDEFPYGPFVADYASARFMYARSTSHGTELYAAAFSSPTWTPPEGARLQALDRIAGAPWGLQYHVRSGRMIVWASERTRAGRNLFSFSLADGRAERITDEANVVAFALDPTERSAAFLAARGTGAEARTCLALYDLMSGTTRDIVCDTPETRFAGPDLSFRPDGGGVILATHRGGDATHCNIAWVDLRTTEPSIAILTDPTEARSALRVARGWLDAERFVFGFRQDGASRIDVGDVAARQTGRVASVDGELQDLAVLVAGERRLAAALVAGTDGSTLRVIDPVASVVLGQQSVEGRARILATTFERMIVASSTRSMPLRVDEYAVLLREPARVEIVSARRAEQLQAFGNAQRPCHAERVMIPRSGSQGAEIRAWSFAPGEVDVRGKAVVLAFDAGQNEYDRLPLALCAAGLPVLAPMFAAGRTTSEEDSVLNEAAAWLAARHRFSPARVGLLLRDDRFESRERDEQSSLPGRGAPWGFALAGATGEQWASVPRSEAPSWLGSVAAADAARPTAGVHVLVLHRTRGGTTVGSDEQALVRLVPIVAEFTQVTAGALVPAPAAADRVRSKREKRRRWIFRIGGLALLAMLGAGAWSSRR